MKCAHSENEVALYVEGDLAPAKASQMEAHLVSCDVCRDLAEDLRESQTMLKSLRQDTVSGAVLSVVRTRVLAEVASVGTRPVWGRWIYAVAGAVFVLLVVAGVLSYKTKPAPVQQIVKSDPLPPLIDAVPAGLVPRAVAVPITKGPLKTTTVAARAKVIVRQEGADTEIPPDPPKQFVVKLLTDDPTVVIYWLVDQKNGGAL